MSRSGQKDWCGEREREREKARNGGGDLPSEEEKLWQVESIACAGGPERTSSAGRWAGWAGTGGWGPVVSVTCLALRCGATGAAQAETREKAGQKEGRDAGREAGELRAGAGGAPWLPLARLSRAMTAALARAPSFSFTSASASSLRMRASSASSSRRSRSFSWACGRARGGESRHFMYHSIRRVLDSPRASGSEIQTQAAPRTFRACFWATWAASSSAYRDLDASTSCAARIHGRERRHHSCNEHVWNNELQKGR